jgi:hypothetical protein
MINLIIDILKADANITAITTTSRIYPVSRLEGGVIPAIVVQLTNTDPADTHDNTTNMDVHTVQVSVIEDRPKEAHALAELCRSALDGYTGGTIAECRFINQATDVFESIDLYTQTMLFRVMLVRDNVTLPTALADLGIFELDDVSDVNAPNPTDGQALIYDDATSTWIPGDVSATLAALTDVALDEPLDREALVYDEATTSWINGGPAKIDFPVYNNDNALTIAVGTVVAFTGVVHGDRMGIAPFSASSANDPRVVVGIAVESIGSRQPGHVRSYGNVYGMNTNAYTVGTILYASTTAGQLTSTPPTAPNHRIAIAVVTKQNANSGRVFCRTYTPAYRLADLSNVASTTPNPGQGLVWNGSTWAPGSVGYVPGSPPPGGFLGNVFYQDNAGNLTFEDAFRYTASTNTLAVENITGTTVTGTGVVKGSNTFGQRYATQAATNRALANTASITVERYFTVTAEGNGESFNIQSNTPSAGNKIVRKIWYKAEAFEATDVNTWTLLHTFADNTTYANTATKWQEYLDGQTYGKPPFTMAISWEDRARNQTLLEKAPGARAAYSLRLVGLPSYTGSAIRVRRASNNAEQDIGFDANGELDTTALTTFCTGTNCFIRTWYDQSGNAADILNTTAAAQPKIYDSRTGVLTYGPNSKPTTNWAGTNGNALNTAAGVLTFDSDKWFVNSHSVYSWTGTNTFSYIWSSASDRGFNIIHENSKQRLSINRSTGFALNSTANAATNTLMVRTDVVKDTSLELYKDGVSQATPGTVSPADFAVMASQMRMGNGGSGSTNHQMQGNISEVIQYNSDTSLDALRSIVEQDQIDYYL